MPKTIETYHLTVEASSRGNAKCLPMIMPSVGDGVSTISYWYFRPVAIEAVELRYCRCRCSIVIAFSLAEHAGKYAAHL